MSLDKHLEHLRCIFKNCDNTLCVKKENCEYCSLEIMFLGHVSSQDFVNALTVVNSDFLGKSGHLRELMSHIRDL